MGYNQNLLDVPCMQRSIKTIFCCLRASEGVVKHQPLHQLDVIWNVIKLMEYGSNACL